MVDLIKKTKKWATNILGAEMERSKNKRYVKANDKKTKKMKGELIDKVSKKQFIKDNGEIAYNKAMDSGSLFSSDRRKYKKTRKNVETKYGYL